MQTVIQARPLSDEGPQQQAGAGAAGRSIVWRLNLLQYKWHSIECHGFAGVGSHSKDPAAAAVGGSEWPAASRLDAWTKSYDRRYFRFYDVQLHPSKLVFFRSEEATETPPETLLLNRLVDGVTRALQVQLVSLAEQFLAC